MAAGCFFFKISSLLLFATASSFSSSLLIKTSADVPVEELNAATAALRSSGYNLFANSLSVSDVLYQILAGDNFTLLSPPDPSLFSLDMTVDSFRYVQSLRLHVLSRRLSLSDLRGLALSQSPFVDSLAQNQPPLSVSAHRSRDISAFRRLDADDFALSNATTGVDFDSIVVDGVRVLWPDIFVGPHIVVHGLEGSLAAEDSVGDLGSASSVPDQAPSSSYSDSPSPPAKNHQEAPLPNSSPTMGSGFISSPQPTISPSLKDYHAASPDFARNPILSPTSQDPGVLAPANSPPVKDYDVTPDFAWNPIISPSRDPVARAPAILAPGSSQQLTPTAEEVPSPSTISPATIEAPFNLVAPGSQDSSTVLPGPVSGPWIGEGFNGSPAPVTTASVSPVSLPPEFKYLPVVPPSTMTPEVVSPESWSSLERGFPESYVALSPWVNGILRDGPGFDWGKMNPVTGSRPHVPSSAKPPHVESRHVASVPSSAKPPHLDSDHVPSSEPPKSPSPLRSPLSTKTGHNNPIPSPPRPMKSRSEPVRRIRYPPILTRRSRQISQQQRKRKGGRRRWRRHLRDASHNGL